MDSLGEKIYRLRKANKVSQEELAFALKTARQTVSRWENGTVKPTFANLESLCKFFNVDNSYFSVAESEEVKAETVRAKIHFVSDEKWKRIIFAVAVVALLTCITVCAFMGFVALAPFDVPASNLRPANFVFMERFRYIGIICLSIGALALILLATLIGIFIKNRKKSKM